MSGPVPVPCGLVSLTGPVYGFVFLLGSVPGPVPSNVKSACAWSRLSLSSHLYHVLKSPSKSVILSVISIIIELICAQVN